MVQKGLLLGILRSNATKDFDDLRTGTKAKPLLPLTPKRSA